MNPTHFHPSVEITLDFQHGCSCLIGKDSNAARSVVPFESGPESIVLPLSGTHDEGAIAGPSLKMVKQLLFDRLDERISRDREEGNYAYFHALTLKLEYLTKIVTTGIVACIGDDADRHRYALEHQLVRADSLGRWVEVLDAALVGPTAEFRRSQSRPLARDLTERVGSSDWRHKAVTDLKFSAEQIGTKVETGNKVSLRRFFAIATQLRNRSTGHGAPTSTECGNACIKLSDALEAVVKNLKLLQCSWVYLRQNINRKYNVSPLLNGSKPFNYLKRTRTVQLQDGVYFHLTGSSDSSNIIHIPLIFSDADILDIALPNGNFKQTNYSFETLSYVTNTVTERDGGRWRDSPMRLTPSQTEGNAELRAYHNVLSNVPLSPANYVHRDSLEERLQQELIDTSRHPIVTLVGPGGIGKTAIALTTITKVARSTDPPYDVILWISARDIDLLESGPKSVQKQVFNKRDIADFTYRLLESVDATIKGRDSIDVFEHALATGADYPTLFIFDNFETVEDPVDVFDWIDYNIKPPNKVLITSRIREFMGDYPIRIGGMNEDEAMELIDSHSRYLAIQDPLDFTYKSTLFNESDGHPYVIKILLGQVASKNRVVAPQRIVASSDNLLRSLFERTYNMLRRGSQRIFLLLSSRRSFVPEVAVEAVLYHTSSERFDVAFCLEQLEQFSLIDRVQSESDEEWFLGVPLVASTYGRKMLQTSRFKSVVESDQLLLRELGTPRRSDIQHGVYPRIEGLIRSCIEEVKLNRTKFNKLLPVLEFLAERVPQTYLRLADLAINLQGTNNGLYLSQQYTRRYLEMSDISDISGRHEAWIRLANLYKKSNDPSGEIHALCEAALLPILQPCDLGDFASRINARIFELNNIGAEDMSSEMVRQNLRNLAQYMERYLDKMSATDCSALAWLLINSGNSTRAHDIAQLGLTKDPQNHQCKSIMEELDKQVRG